MARGGRKGLSAEDRALWNRVADSATPMHKRRPKAELDAALTLNTPKPAKPEPGDFEAQWRASPFEIGAKSSPRPAPSLPMGAKPAPVRMDRRSFQNMRRGKIKPDARIDLHGMTVAVAHPALVGFVLKSHDAGRRLLLVITGKGKGGQDDGPIPAQRGILRRQVPHWLEIPPLSSVVLQVEQAHDRHGGAGAFYVYLRRRG